MPLSVTWWSFSLCCWTIYKIFPSKVVSMMDNFFPLISDVFSWHSALSNLVLPFVHICSLPDSLCCQPSASLSPGGMQALALYPLPTVFVSPFQVCVRVRSYVKVLIIFCLEFFSSAQIILVSHLHSWKSKINRDGEMEESWKDLLLHIK